MYCVKTKGLLFKLRGRRVRVWRRIMSICLEKGMRLEVFKGLAWAYRVKSSRSIILRSRFSKEQARPSDFRPSR